MVTFMLNQPEKPDDADNPLRTVYMGPLSQHEEFARALRRAHLHGLRDDRGAGADRLRPRPGRRARAAAAPPTRCTTSCGSSTRTTSRCRRTRRASSIARHTLPWTINSGYKNMPEATAEAWRNGWFHTGDQFTQDEDGQLLLPRPDQGRDPAPRREHLVVRGRDRGDEPSARQGRRRDRGAESRRARGRPATRR